MTEQDFPDALPPGHRLHWYVLERVLGQGGFGITYLAHDTNLDRRVAIKEYLPAEVARRRSDASARPRTESHAERFAWGLERFLSEARTLARFDHPNIVRVLSIFEANSTAYMVMRFEEGEDLGTLLDRRGTLPQRELLEFLLPVLSGLQLIHSSGFIHRDIKPENMYIRDDGSPVLLDFGSARQSFGSAKTMTILVAPGYAPLEQYYGDAKTQGAWTDIYGLAATCYRAVSGKAPLDAVARAKGVLGSTRDLLEPTAAVAQGSYDTALLTAIDHGLQLNERDRPQSIAEWRRQIVVPDAGASANRAAAGEPRPVEALSRGPTPSALPAVTSVAGAGELPSQTATALRHTPPAAGTRSGFRWAAAVVICAAGVAALVAFLRTPHSSEPVLATAPRTPSPTIEHAAALDTVAPTVTSGKADPSASSASSAVAPAGPIASAPMLESPPERAVPPSRAPFREARSPPADGGAREQKGVAQRNVEPPSALTARTSSPTPASVAIVAAVTPATRSAVVPSQAVSATPGSSAAGSAPAAATIVVATAPAAPVATSRRRDEQLDAAEAALRRGDAAGAAQMAAPLAAAGVARAQTLLGRAQEARSKDQHNDFEAYVWYSIAARSGEPAAQSLKERVAGRLQPAEIRQAEQIIDRWKPRTENAAESSAERIPP